MKQFRLKRSRPLGIITEHGVKKADQIPLGDTLPTLPRVIDAFRNPGIRPGTTHELVQRRLAAFIRITKDYLHLQVLKINQSTRS